MKQRPIAVLGSLLVFAMTSCTTGTPKNHTPQSTAGSERSVPPTSLTMEDALDWRRQYADLLGKTKDAAVERYGTPTKEDVAGGLLQWGASPKTGDRGVNLTFNGGRPARAVVVKVFARTLESVNPLDILKKAELFKFITGTYEDAARNYFSAETIDGRNAFQFDVSDTSVIFRAMMFRDPKLL